jgi:tetratricopeptide (TPR) repeat protein
MSTTAKILTAVGAVMLALYVAFSFDMFVQKDSGTSNAKHILADNAEDVPLEAIYSQIMEHIRDGKFDEVIASADRALVKHPRVAQLHYFRGFAYLQNNVPDKAIADLSAAIEIQPTYADAYSYRAWAYAGQGQLDPALADAAKVIELNPNNPEGYLARGAVLLTKKDYDQARAAVTKALEIDPTSEKGKNLLQQIPATSAKK